MVSVLPVYSVHPWYGKFEFSFYPWPQSWQFIMVNVRSENVFTPLSSPKKGCSNSLFSESPLNDWDEERNTQIGCTKKRQSICHQFFQTNVKCYRLFSELSQTTHKTAVLLSVNVRGGDDVWAQFVFPSILLFHCDFWIWILILMLCNSCGYPEKIRRKNNFQLRLLLENIFF